MKLSPPKNGTWSLAVLIGLLGILSFVVELPLISDYSFELVTTAFGLLLIGTLFKGI
jgi:hypothetical protein